MRALVTGASGFIGRHLVRHLRDAGDQVVCSDRSGATGADLTDVEVSRSLLQTARPEVVYHLAGFSNVGASWRDPVGAFDANTRTTLCVLVAAADVGVQKVIVASSADVYGAVDDGALPVGEDAPLRPVSPYAASKVAAEYLALQAHIGGGVPTVRARLFNQLGPGQSDRFVVPALAKQIVYGERRGEAVVKVGNLSARRDFTDVRDSIRALRLLAERGEPGEVYNLCSGTDHAVQEVAEFLLGLARTSLSLEVDPSRVRAVDLPVLRGDPARIRQATGWTPAIPLAQTLGDVLGDWRGRVGSGTHSGRT